MTSLVAIVHEDQEVRNQAFMDTVDRLTPIQDETEWKRVTEELFEAHKARWGEDYANRLMSGAAQRAMVNQLLDEQAAEDDDET